MCTPWALLAAQHPWDAPVGGGGPAARMGTEQSCTFLCAGAAPCQALIRALLQGPAWLDLGSGQALRAS